MLFYLKWNFARNLVNKLLVDDVRKMPECKEAKLTKICPTTKIIIQYIVINF